MLGLFELFNFMSVSMRGGVIWISGYSASGKTTVGRIVESSFANMNKSTIFLDGDDLRSIFSGKWGYGRDQRVELVRVYLRLCNHFASQGHIVVISTIGLYEDAFCWVRQYIYNSLIVFLRVPKQIRLERDLSTKNVYRKMAPSSSIYDEGAIPDLYIDNFGMISAEHAATDIVHAFMNKTPIRRDLGRRDYWDSFYSLKSCQLSMLAIPTEIMEYFARSSPRTVLEIGCGTGETAYNLAVSGCRLTGIDLSKNAVELCQAKLKDYDSNFVQVFEHIPDSILEATFDVFIYNHSLDCMPLEEELQYHNLMRSGALKSGGIIYIKVLSVNDPSFRSGEVISPRERLHERYTRFFSLSDLKELCLLYDLEAIELSEFSENRADDSEFSYYKCIHLLAIKQ